MFPLLCPSLNNLYPKITGKDSPNAQIWVNCAVRNDLLWAASHLKIDNGVYLLRASDWNPSEADIVIYCDACLDGLGFWYPADGNAYFSHVPVEVPINLIFYYKALCVLCALEHASSRLTSPSRIAIYTDNSNTVDIFNSLRCLPPYNKILKRSASLRMSTDHQLRVFHVSSENNYIADAISRESFTKALLARPDLQIHHFQPPQLTLGETKK